MIWLKDRPIAWSPLNVPQKSVPGHVVEDQREGGPVYIRLDGNGQLLVVAPERVHPRGRWDGHEWEPDGKLGAKPTPPGPLVEMPLPGRLVQAAQDAIEEAALTTYRGHTEVYAVDGYPLDLAKAAAAAVIEGLAEVWADDLCCGPGPNPQCGKCGRLYGEIAELQYLANRVREVA
jgi:hypothetical protein